MNYLFVRVDLAILPPKQFRLATLLVENQPLDQARNATIKGLISLGFYCLSQKELNLFSSNTVQKIQIDSKIFRFRIYDSPELILFKSISKKARRATLNALLYTGVNELQSIAVEYCNSSISEYRKHKIEDLIFKTGLYKEFELVQSVAKLETSTTLPNELIKNEVTVMPLLKDLDLEDGLSKLPIPVVDKTNINDFVSNNPQLQPVVERTKQTEVELNDSRTNLNTNEFRASEQNNLSDKSQINSTSHVTESSNLIENTPISTPVEKSVNNSRWKKMKIDSI